MTTHSRIILKKYNNFPFLNTFEFRLDSNEWFKTQMLCNL
jgi:hypothetical protein